VHRDFFSLNCASYKPTYLITLLIRSIIHSWSFIAVVAFSAKSWFTLNLQQDRVAADL